jgi:O-acetyl-ADP-ribose deacetylase (regulator of RNase III)
MHLQHTTGNLITLAENGEFNIIVHGCNCFNTMGSGIAKEMRERYPTSYFADCHTASGDRNKLGTYSFVATDKFMIINAYTQFNYNRQGERNDVFEYTAFKLILEKLAHLSGSNNFGFPYIGMGKAGGDTDRIMAMLEEFAEKISEKGGTVTLVQFH